MYQLIFLLLILIPKSNADINPDLYNCKYSKGPFLTNAKEINVIDTVNNIKEVCLGQAQCKISVMDAPIGAPSSYKGWTVCLPDKKSKKCNKTPNECLKDNDLNFLDKNIGDKPMLKKLDSSPEAVK